MSLRVRLLRRCWQRRRRRSQAGRSLGSADGRTDGRMARSSIVVEPSVTVMACHGRASVHCPFSPSPSPVYPSPPPSRRPRLCVFLARPFQSITLTHARAVCPSVRSSAILCCVVFVDRGCWRLRPQVCDIVEPRWRVTADTDVGCGVLRATD